MAATSIEWTDETWNPLRGCTEVSPGCRNCYAAVMAHRFSGPGQPYEGLVERRPNGKIVWTGQVRLVPEKLDEPLRRRKPTTYFVNSMSDLFHEDVPFDFIDQVFAVMAISGWHTYQVLTKRAGRMAGYFAEPNRRDLICAAIEKQGWRPKGGLNWLLNGPGSGTPDGKIKVIKAGWLWPLPNVWLGVSVEDQARADERIPHLLRVPAAVRFLSCEPLLAEVDLHRVARRSGYGSTWIDALRGRNYSISPGSGDQPPYRDCPRIDWTIIGGESGPGARPCDLAWIRSLVRQCRAAEVPAFVKQLGAHVQARNDEVADWFAACGHLDLSPTERFQGAIGRVRGFRDSKGGDMDEFPADLRVRELPAVAPEPRP